MDNIFDRGTKKWTAMMLPEHVKMLREIDNEYVKTNKPALDGYQLDEIHEMIDTSLEFHLPLKFELWFNGLFEELEGVLVRVDDINKLVWVRERNDDLHKVKYENITGVEFVTD